MNRISDIIELGYGTINNKNEFVNLLIKIEMKYTVSILLKIKNQSLTFDNSNDIIEYISQRDKIVFSSLELSLIPKDDNNFVKSNGIISIFNSKENTLWQLSIKNTLQKDRDNVVQIAKKGFNRFGKGIIHKQWNVIIPFIIGTLLFLGFGYYYIFNPLGDHEYNVWIFVPMIIIYVIFINGGDAFIYNILKASIYIMNTKEKVDNSNNESLLGKISITLKRFLNSNSFKIYWYPLLLVILGTIIGKLL